tara:strand:- start:12 stop:407 length:396 start_codon:yes stop_codon:yes gene_type:complete
MATLLPPSVPRPARRGAADVLLSAALLGGVIALCVRLLGVEERLARLEAATVHRPAPRRPAWRPVVESEEEEEEGGGRAHVPRGKREEEEKRAYEPLQPLQGGAVEAAAATPLPAVQEIVLEGEDEAPPSE